MTIKINLCWDILLSRLYWILSKLIDFDNNSEIFIIIYVIKMNERMLGLAFILFGRSSIYLTSENL